MVSLTPNQFSIAFPSTQRSSNYNILSGFRSILCFIYLPLLRIGMLKIIMNRIILYRYNLFASLNIIFLRSVYDVCVHAC